MFTLMVGQSLYSRTILLSPGECFNLQSAILSQEEEAWVLVNSWHYILLFIHFHSFLRKFELCQHLHVQSCHPCFSPSLSASIRMHRQYWFYAWFDSILRHSMSMYCIDRRHSDNMSALLQGYSNFLFPSAGMKFYFSHDYLSVSDLKLNWGLTIPWNFIVNISNFSLIHLPILSATSCYTTGVSVIDTQPNRLLTERELLLLSWSLYGVSLKYSTFLIGTGIIHTI